MTETENHYIYTHEPNTVTFLVNNGWELYGAEVVESLYVKYTLTRAKGKVSVPNTIPSQIWPPLVGAPHWDAPNTSGDIKKRYLHEVTCYKAD